MKAKTKKVWLAQKEVEWFVKQFQKIQKEADGSLLRIKANQDTLREKVNDLINVLDTETYAIHSLGKTFKDVCKSEKN
jgi:hypothetical protein